MGKDRNFRYMLVSNSGESTTQAKHPFSIFLMRKAFWFGRRVLVLPLAFSSTYTARPFSLLPTRSDIPSGADLDFKYLCAAFEYVAFDSMTSTSKFNSLQTSKTNFSTIFSGVIYA